MIAEKKLELERVQKVKEEWERKILGIGKCMETHGDEKDDIALPQPQRPNSAPLLQPRPPSTRRANASAFTPVGKQNKNSVII